MDRPQNLRSCFSEAEAKRKSLNSAFHSTSPAFQEILAAAISLYEECLNIVEQVSLFSPNETLEDIASTDLQYLLIRYHIAELLLRSTSGDRKHLIQQARKEFDHLLKLLDSYDMLSRDEAKTYERYLDSPEAFSTVSSTDAAARRHAKIARFKEEKELRQKLDILQQSPGILQNDEAARRDLHLTNISLCTHQTFQSLESIAQEMQILALAPPSPPKESSIPDHRHRSARDEGYSERLDSPLSQLVGGKGGPILSKAGKPIRPFTLLDTRQRLQQGVFRPDHNLPTMTIDEYLEEEKRRGGIIEGGGPQSEVRPEPNEDDMDKADEETMKARAWDEFKEENPKGAGNTMNMG